MNNKIIKITHYLGKLSKLYQKHDHEFYQTQLLVALALNHITQVPL